MADELTVTGSIAYSKNGLSFNYGAPILTVDVSGDHVASGTQEVGTSAEPLEKGDITTPGWLFIQNLDSTNYIEVGYDDTGFKPTVRVNAGEWACFRVTQATPQVKADTGACDVAYWLFEA